MERISWSIIDQNDWFSTQNMMFTYSEEEQEENKIAKNNADCAFKPKFIPVYTAMLSHFSLIEATIFGFIDFYLSNNKRFYWSNEKIAEMLNISERSVTWAISHLEAEWLIKTKYRIKAWWGKIRFVEKENDATQTSKICYSNKNNMLDIYNKKINNNKDIDKSISLRREEKNDKNEYKIYWEFEHIKLTDEQYEKLRKLVWWWIRDLIEECDRWLELNPRKKYKNYYAFIKNWYKKNQKWIQNEVEVKQKLYANKGSKYIKQNDSINKQKQQQKFQQFLDDNKQYNGEDQNQTVNRRTEIWGEILFWE